ncbi:MAG: M28 family metallopeptidase [Oligoflexales bacterium]
MKILKFLIILNYCISFKLAAKEREVHFSLVKKGSVHSFISRFVSTDHQLIASSVPIKQAIKAIKISEQANEQLFFVELTTRSKNRIEGEIVRFGSLAVVKKQKSDLHEGHFHNLANPLEYWEAIPHGKTTTKPALKPKYPVSTKSSFSVPNISIDNTYLISKLKELSGLISTKIGDEQVKLGERFSESGKKLARQFLSQEYAALGYEIREHKFGLFTTGVNFIAEKKGTNTSFYVISSHYDTVRTVGADDDGSGVIASLAIAKALKDMNHEFGIRFVAFDQEERGLLGSKAYASYLKSQSELDDMLGLIQLEMLGWDEDQDAKLHVVDCDENTSSELTAMVLATIKDLNINLSQNDACTNRSDHASFWRYNKPAIVISQNFFGGDSNPCYHRSCDQFEKINLPYLQAITNATANSMAKMLRIF